jgi:hypothetical protein
MFRPVPAKKQFACATKPFFVFRASVLKQPMVTNPLTKAADSVGNETGDSQMRTLSFILALAFVVAGPSIAGSVDSRLPGVGTFAYGGSPPTNPAPQALVVAVR